MIIMILNAIDKQTTCNLSGQQLWHGSSQIVNTQKARMIAYQFYHATDLKLEKLLVASCLSLVVQQ